jgi:uncharacterized membrane protein YfcA
MIATGLVILVAAVVQYAAGFGFALMATPLLSLVLGAHDAVLVAVFMGLAGNVTMAWSGRTVLDRGVLTGVLSWSPVGLAIGVVLYTNVDDATLQLVVAGAVTAAVISLVSGWRIQAASRRSNAVVGVLAGALTTSTGTNGPPIVTLLVCLPALVVGGWAGTRCRALLSPTGFRRLVMVLLAASAVTAAAAAVVG